MSSSLTDRDFFRSECHKRERRSGNDRDSLNQGSDRQQQKQRGTQDDKKRNQPPR
jgi:hypothetical protein